MIELNPIERLSRDLKKAAATLSPGEARYLVDSYYSIQEYRKASGNQVRALSEGKEPCEVIGWLNGQMETLEGQIKRALDAWTSEQPVGKWAKALTGIGPVLAAGLLAHIDIDKAPTVGHIWRFAGLDPTREWLGKEKSIKLVAECLEQSGSELERALIIAAQRTNVRPENLRHAATTDREGKTVPLTKASLTAALAKRPCNARLKVLAWKCGESFVKVCNNEDDVYGKVYVARKEQEARKNLNGDFAEQARAILAAKKIDKSTDAYAAYSKGMLPPAHIHSRAKRYAVKLFLSAYHEAAFFARFQKMPPKPYVIEHLGHVHYIAPPNIDLIPGWTEARAK